MAYLINVDTYNDTHVVSRFKETVDDIMDSKVAELFNVDYEKALVCTRDNFPYFKSTENSSLIITKIS